MYADESDEQGVDYSEQLSEQLADAVSSKDLEACRELLAAGADPDGEAKLIGQTLLTNAIAYDFNEGVELLLTSGASANAVTPDGDVPLAIAGRYGKLEICRDLIAHGADLNARDSDNCTALHHAAAGGHIELCKLLLDAGADINLIDDYDRTPLHDAAASGLRIATEVCDLLIAAGASPSYYPPGACQQYLTALQLAASSGHEQVVEHFLTKHKEDPSQRTLEGDSLETLAEMHEPIMQLIRMARTTQGIEEAVLHPETGGSASPSRTRCFSPI